MGEPKIEALLVDPFVGRAGSTLVMKLLGTSDAIAFDRLYPYEYRYLAYLTRFLDLVAGRAVAPSDTGIGGPLREPAPPLGPLPFDPEAVDRDDLARRLCRHSWQALCESLSQKSGERLRYYAEKSWWNTPETLAGAGVPVKLINLVRDPRDVAASVLAFDRQRGYHGFGRTAGQSEAEYIPALALKMRESLARMELRAGRFEHIWIRYEDLVRAPTQAAAQLGSFLGVDVDAGAAVAEGPEYEMHRSSSSPLASVGRWRADLAPQFARQLEAALGSEIERWGYASTAHSAARASGSP